MKAPRCRLCGKEEWRHVCGVGVFSERLKVPDEAPVVSKSEPVAVVDKPLPASKPDVSKPPKKPKKDAPKKRGRPKGNTDRKAYRREWMRDKRAIDRYVARVVPTPPELLGK
jgi:hypothetical protein